MAEQEGFKSFQERKNEILDFYGVQLPEAYQKSIDKAKELRLQQIGAGSLPKTSAEAAKFTRQATQSFQMGGVVPKTGLAMVHKGETIIPANKGANVIISIGNINNMDERKLSEMLYYRLKNTITT